MPKVVKLRHQRAVKQSEPYATHLAREKTQGESTSENDSSKGHQRKRHGLKERQKAKLAMIENSKQKFLSSDISKKLDLSFFLKDMADSLPAEKSDTDSSKNNHVKTNKMKKSVALRETERMKLIQQHPLFVKDPIAAAHAHLEQILKSKAV